MALIPGQETKIPHASEQLSPGGTTREARVRQPLRLCALEAMLCNWRSLPWAATREKPACHNEDLVQPKIKKKFF